MKSDWMPSGQDKEPWIAVHLGKPAPVSQIQIREGRFNQGGNIKSFVVEAKIDGQWKTIHTGTRIGGDCGIVLPQPVTSDSFRIRILESTGAARINCFDLF